MPPPPLTEATPPSPTEEEALRNIYKPANRMPIPKAFDIKKSIEKKGFLMRFLKKKYSAGISNA